MDANEARRELLDSLLMQAGPEVEVRGHAIRNIIDKSIFGKFWFLV